MTQAGRRWLPPLMGVALLAVLLGVYANALRNPFIIDDVEAIQENEHVLEPRGIRYLWVDNYWRVGPELANLYRPVTTLTYYLNARMPGVSHLDDDGNRTDLRPIGFRLVNVALLAALAWVVGLWLGCYVQPWAAWSAAALFALHPSNGYLISPVVGRADLLALLGVVWFLYLQKLAADRGRWSAVGLIAAATAAAIALGAKESGAILLLLAPIQAIVNAEFRTRKPGLPVPAILRRHSFLTAAALLGPLVLYVMGRAYSLEMLATEPRPENSDLMGNPLRGRPLLDRLPAAMDIAWWYARQTIWPNLGYYHIPRELPTWGEVTPWLGVSVLCVCTVVWLRLLQIRHWTSIGLAAAVGGYLVVGNLVTPIGVYAANRLMPPFLFAAAVVLAALLNRAATTRRRVAALVIVVSVGLTAGVVTMTQVNPRWSSWSTLAAMDVRRDPDNVVFQYDYAVALLVEARYESDPEQFMRKTNHAARIMEAVLARRPDSLQARRQLASLYVNLRYDDKAMRQMREVLRRWPNDAGSWRDLGTLYLRQSRPADADAALARSLELEPADPKTLLGHARAAAALNDTDEAISRYRALLDRYPDDESARAELSQLLVP